MYFKAIGKKSIFYFDKSISYIFAAQRYDIPSLYIILIQKHFHSEIGLQKFYWKYIAGDFFENSSLM